MNVQTQVIRFKFFTLTERQNMTLLWHPMKKIYKEIDYYSSERDREQDVRVLKECYLGLKMKRGIS